MKPREKRYLTWIFALAFASGAGLFVFSHWLRTTTAIGEQHFAAEHWLRVGHVSLTYLLVLALGFAVKSHVQPSLRRHLRRVSGLLLLSYWGVLIISAVVLLYTGGDGLGPVIAAWTHGILGLSAPVLIFAHNRKHAAAS